LKEFYDEQYQKLVAQYNELLSDETILKSKLATLQERFDDKGMQQNNIP